MPSPNPNPTRIALRLPEYAYTGKILLGALRAAHRRNWIISLGENAPDFMLRHGLRGIIGMNHAGPPAVEYERVGLPFIYALDPTVPGSTATVAIDHDRVGAIAAEHLLECGFRDFGIVTYPTRHGPLRLEGFRRTISPHAQSFSVCPVYAQNTPEDFDAMLAWLKSLPKPTGIFAVDDPVGGAVTEVCELGGVRVPADVAVVSVNDDGVRTVASRPPLSSVRIPWERIGKVAVDLLAEHLSAPGTAPKLQIVAPQGVAVRASSDITVISDTEVAAALAFIRQNVHRSISVDDVVDATTVSRRLLERRFKLFTRRTVLEQIHHDRLERAKSMLTETSLRVSDVAEQCGFGSRAQFHRRFFEATEQTPDDYRRRTRQDETHAGP